MFRNFTIIVFSILLAGTVLAPNALADAGNKEVLFTIHHPIEIPGRVLNPGKYDLQLLHFGGSVAVIWSANHGQFYGMIPTTPVSRVHGINHARVDVSREPDSVARIKDWFYPGDDYGYRFVYSSTQKQVAKVKSSSPQNNG